MKKQDFSGRDFFGVFKKQKTVFFLAWTETFQ